MSKATLDVAFTDGMTVRRWDYDAAGIATCIEVCRATGVTLVVLEATGGLERRLTRALAGAAVAFHVANPRQVRDLARAMGRLAKTDAIDARVLVDYGMKLRPQPHALPDENRQKLRDWAARHQQLTDARTAELNRHQACETPTIRTMIERHIDFIEQQIADVADAMDALIEADAALQNHAAMIESTPGLGRLTARRLLAELPELGQRNPRQLAKLVGVAPINRDSGTLRGKRTTGGGRRSVRKLLYMPTLVATRYNPRIHAMYQRLIANGKPKMLALVACMRKLLIYLNAMIRENKTWEQFIQTT